MMNIFSVKIWLLAGFAAVVLTGCDKVNFMQQNIAYVDMAVVLTDSPVGKQEAERNQKVQDIILKADHAVQDTYKTVTGEELQKRQAADAAALNQLWQGEQQHARMASLKAIATEVEEYRKSHHLDMVISREEVIAADNKYDISAEITRHLSGVVVDYGKLPTVSIKNEKQNGGTADVENNN